MESDEFKATVIAHALSFVVISAVLAKVKPQTVDNEKSGVQVFNAVVASGN